MRDNPDPFDEPAEVRIAGLTAADFVTLPLALSQAKALDGDRVEVGELFLVRDMVIGIAPVAGEPAHAVIHCAGGYSFTVATSPRAVLLAMTGLEAAGESP